MTAEKVGVDPQTLELARHFLADMGGQDTLLADLLAERIQSAVEDWFEENVYEGFPPRRLRVIGGRSDQHSEGAK